MKSIFCNNKYTAAIIIGAALTITNIGAGPATAKGGATRLIELNRPAATAAVAPPAVKAMNCATCADIAVARREANPKGGAKALVERGSSERVIKHTCAKCGTEFKVEGHGKAKTDVRTHTCSKCT